MYLQISSELEKVKQENEKVKQENEKVKQENEKHKQKISELETSMSQLVPFITMLNTITGNNRVKDNETKSNCYQRKSISLTC